MGMLFFRCRRESGLLDLDIGSDDEDPKCNEGKKYKEASHLVCNPSALEILPLPTSLVDIGSGTKNHPLIFT